jgi:hypothetical protein
VLGTCVPCGHSLQPCCAAAECATGFICAIGLTCTACGGSVQPCCPGDTCGGSRTCTLGFCG